MFQPQLLLPPLEDNCPPPPGNDSTPTANGTAPDGGNPSAANGTGALRQVASQPQLMDYGSVYASQSFEAEDGRRVWLGWAYEVRDRCGMWLHDKGHHHRMLDALPAWDGPIQTRV